jgi:hypothetical protein
VKERIYIPPPTAQGPPLPMGSVLGGGLSFGSSFGSSFGGSTTSPSSFSSALGSTFGTTLGPGNKLSSFTGAIENRRRGHTISAGFSVKRMDVRSVELD